MVKASPSTAESRSHILLAPVQSQTPACFNEVLVRPLTRERLLARVQRLRGLIYLQNGNLTPHELTADGRHESPLDDISWHLVALNPVGDVVGCVRMLMHSHESRFEKLFASNSALARSATWGGAVRAAIQRERTRARRKGLAFFEVGAWALADSVRYSTEAARLALGAFAFGQLIGGAVGITTATLMHHSASILRRIGGTPLQHNGAEFPVYYDPQHFCDMAMLQFDSDGYDPKYHLMVEQLRLELKTSPVLCSTAEEIPQLPVAVREFHPWVPQAIPLPAV